MSAWIVREEIEPIDLAAYEQAAGALTDALRTESGRYHRTYCPRYGDPDVPVKSFLWVKVLDCEACGAPVDLFPGSCSRRIDATRRTSWCVQRVATLQILAALDRDSQQRRRAAGSPRKGHGQVSCEDS